MGYEICLAPAPAYYSGQQKQEEGYKNSYRHGSGTSPCNLPTSFRIDFIINRVIEI